MEENDFLTQLIKLKKEKNISFNNYIKAFVTDIEQYDYNLFKLTIIADNVKYKGIFLENNQNLLINEILIKELYILKPNVHENIKILIKSCGLLDVKINNQDKIKATYDLSEFPKIFNTIEKGNYKSDFFIY